MSRDDSHRAIRVSKPVKAALVELRLLEQNAIPPHLDRGALERVEGALDCKLPEDLLAILAAQCEAFRELGMVPERIATLAAEARTAGCPAELVAIGRGEG